MLKLWDPNRGKSKRWFNTGGTSLSEASLFGAVSAVFFSNGERGTPMPCNGSSISTVLGAEGRRAVPPRLRGTPDTEALIWYRVAVSGAKNQLEGE